MEIVVLKLYFLIQLSLNIIYIKYISLLFIPTFFNRWCKITPQLRYKVLQIIFRFFLCGNLLTAVRNYSLISWFFHLTRIAFNVFRTNAPNTIVLANSCLVIRNMEGFLTADGGICSLQQLFITIYLFLSNKARLLHFNGIQFLTGFYNIITPQCYYRVWGDFDKNWI